MIASASPSPAKAANQAAASGTWAQSAARWLNRLSGVLLVIAVGSTLGALAPGLRLAAGSGSAALEEGAQPRPMFALPGSADPSPLPKFADDDDEDEPHLTELERMYPDGMWPGQKHRGSRRGADSAGDSPAARHGGAPSANEDTDRGGPTGARKAFALAPLELRLKPEDGAPTTGAVIRAGEIVMILKEAGAFSLVLYNGTGDVQMGWVKRDEVAVR